MKKLAHTFIVLSLLGLCACSSAPDSVLSGTWSVEEGGMTTIFVFSGPKVTIKHIMERDDSPRMLVIAEGTHTVDTTVEPHELTMALVSVDANISIPGLSAEEEEAKLAKSGIAKSEVEAQLKGTYAPLTQALQKYTYARDGRTLTLDGAQEGDSFVLTRQ